MNRVLVSVPMSTEAHYGHIGCHREMPGFTRNKK